MMGNRIPDSGEREYARMKLVEFMEKHKGQFEAFWRENGFGIKPPIKYHLGNRQWVWVGDDD